VGFLGGFTQNGIYLGFWTLSSFHESLRSIHYQTCEHTMFENESTDFHANWHKWCTEIGTKHSCCGSGGQRSVSRSAEIGCKNPFWRHTSRAIWQILTKHVRHIFQWSRSVRWCLAVGLACGDQRRLTGSGSTLEAVLHDDALYKSTFTLLYFTSVNAHCVTATLMQKVRGQGQISRSKVKVTSGQLDLEAWRIDV